MPRLALRTHRRRESFTQRPFVCSFLFLSQLFSRFSAVLVVVKLFIKFVDLVVLAFGARIVTVSGFKRVVGVSRGVILLVTLINVPDVILSGEHRWFGLRRRFFRRAIVTTAARRARRAAAATATTTRRDCGWQLQGLAQPIRKIVVVVVVPVLQTRWNRLLLPTPSGSLRALPFRYTSRRVRSRLGTRRVKRLFRPHMRAGLLFLSHHQLSLHEYRL